MAEIKRILQIKESNQDFSNRQIGKIVNCSKDMVKVILSLLEEMCILSIQSKLLIVSKDKVNSYLFYFVRHRIISPRAKYSL